MRREAPPPSNPRAWIVAGMLIIAAAFGGFGTWASFASLDSAAIAPGVVVVETDRKSVQHLEGGLVKEILVRDGARVAKGDVLIRLEDTHARAMYDIVRGELDAALAEQSRLVSEHEGREDIVFPAELLARAHIAKVSKALQGQRHLFTARRNALNGQIAILEQNIAQFREEIEGLKAQQVARERQLRILEDELRGLRKLLAQGNVPRNEVLAYERKIAELAGERGLFTADVARAEQSIGEARLRIGQLEKSAREEVAAKLGEVQERIFGLEERLVAAEDVLRRTEIRAPSDGVVMGMQARTTGGVIAPAQEILQVVPVGDRLVVEARVDPIDIDDVALGQQASVRLSAFKLRSTPIILGTVINLSADRLVDPHSGAPYYLARIEVSKEELASLGELQLQPGMPVDTLIKTGARTALSYMLSPLTESMGLAFREK
ncbi:MAG: HlyD family type I secretion periplasmic adaptor subunit [Gammaproteobacteria bacterium]|nr:HlyD family type I secretion periplasmic adaptor subunit [Gammaproteobacteria bacterium]NIU40855.1 HlyD family type I secretion periplasmic adaptor subunit [Gammaproteobacteria bacterium]NIW55850.1 HlyD family type I secretion periplasmic adaptor subunit [Gammaproteobacteria bacterium]